MSSLISEKDNLRHNMVAMVIEVENYPCLWNLNCKDYCKREARREAYKKVARTIGMNS